MSGADERTGFPISVFPADETAQRLVGLYPQVQEGLWMQRIKVLGGRLTAIQWQTLAEIAKDLTPATPLHLTTRQDVELHGLTADRAVLAQRAIATVGLTGLGAGGDTLRNITVCPCSGTTAAAPDLVPLAWQVRGVLEATAGILALPRKFKISFSACAQGCGQPWINDLGFVARQGDGRWGFEVVAGGSLGSRPLAATRIFDFLPAEEVLPCVLGAIRVFAAHGDREHRGRARLRHVRERFGDERVLAMVRDALVAAKAERPWPAPPWVDPGEAFDERLTLVFPNGDVTPQEAAALAGLAQDGSLRVRIGNQHRVILFGRDGTAPAAVARWPALDRARTPQPSVVACPGRRWCRRGLADTRALADRLRALPAGSLPPGATVCISGCPNGCAHSAVADIGLIGVRAAGREAYHLFIGGGMGRNDRLAEPAGRNLLPDDVVDRLARR